MSGRRDFFVRTGGRKRFARSRLVLRVRLRCSHWSVLEAVDTGQRMAGGSGKSPHEETQGLLRRDQFRMRTPIIRCWSARRTPDNASLRSNLRGQSGRWKRTSARTSVLNRPSALKQKRLQRNVQRRNVQRRNRSPPSVLRLREGEPLAFVPYFASPLTWLAGSFLALLAGFGFTTDASTTLAPRWFA